MISIKASALIVSLVLAYNLILLLDRHISEQETPAELRQQPSVSLQTHVTTSHHGTSRMACENCQLTTYDAINRQFFMRSPSPSTEMKPYKISSIALTWIIGVSLVCLALLIRLTRSGNK